MNESGKKRLRKKYVTHFWTNFWKNNEGNKIIIKLTYRILMRANKKTSLKAYLEKCFFVFRNKLVFCGMFLIFPDMNCFFGNLQLSDALGRKKRCFFGNALPESDVHDHLKLKKT